MTFKSILYTIMTILFIGTLLISEGITSGIAGVGKAAHVNVAIFYMYDGNYTPPKRIQGHDIISQLHGKAQFLNIVHTTGVKNGDVLMMQADVLRGSGEKSDDFGVDCQLVLHIKDESDVTIQGLCETFFFDISHQEEVKAKTIIKPTLLEDKGWNLIGYDAKDRIAIYADEEVGTH